jgi:hypothetical protein
VGAYLFAPQIGAATHDPVRSRQPRFLPGATTANTVNVNAAAKQTKVKLRARNLAAKIPLAIELGRGHSSAPSGLSAGPYLGSLRS